MKFNMSTMTIMDIETFAKEIASRVVFLLREEGVRIEGIRIGYVQDEKGVTRMAIDIELMGFCMMARRYVDEDYALFKKMVLAGEFMEIQLLNEIAHAYVKQFGKFSMNLSILDCVKQNADSLDVVLQYISPTIVKREGNTEFLKDKVWRPFLDVAIVYYLNVIIMDDGRVVLGRKDACGGNAAFTYVSPHMLNELKLTEEMLYDLTVKNVCMEFTARKVEDILGEDDVFPGMLVVTNERYVNGAGVILAEEKLRELAKMNNVSRFLVLPSSIHECIIVFDDTCTEFFKQMVQEANESQVSPEDRLSDSVYIFDVKTGLQIA